MNEECLKYNKLIKSHGLVKLTWGNVSICDHRNHIVYIKPSGVNLSTLKKEDISLVDLKTGSLISGLKQSVDTNIHLEVYRNFKRVKSIVHTHSKYATSWAQAEVPIPCLGTTHADYFDGEVPVVRNLKQSEILNDYELNIGKIVVEHFKGNNLCPLRKGAVLLPKHGVLTFGKDARQSLENSIVLEEIAEMAHLTNCINSDRMVTKDQEFLFKKHYDRKHGVDKYYGQGQ